MILREGLKAQLHVIDIQQALLAQERQRIENDIAFLEANPEAEAELDAAMMMVAYRNIQAQADAWERMMKENRSPLLDSILSKYGL